MFLKVQYRWLLLQASASNYPFQQPGKVERQIPVYPLQQPLGFHGHSLLAVKQADSIFQGAVIVAQAAEHRLAQFRVGGILPAIALLHDDFPPVANCPLTDANNCRPLSDVIATADTPLVSFKNLFPQKSPTRMSV